MKKNMFFMTPIVPGSGHASQRTTAARRSRTVAILCVFLGALTASTATAQTLAIKTSSPTQQPRTVTFEEMLAGSVVLEFSDYPGGQVELYKKSATVEAREQQSCRLMVVSSQVTLAKETPGEPCRELLAPLWKNQAIDLAVSVAPSTKNTVSTAYALVKYKPPGPYQGKDPVIAVPRSKDDTPDWSKAKVPEHVALISSDCYVLLDDWHKLGCDPSTRSITTMLPATKAMLAAKWAKDQTVDLLASVTDAESKAAWRSFSFVLESKPRDPPSGPPDPSKLPQLCHATALELEQGSVPLKAESFYFICVDMASRAMVTLSCEKLESPTACSLEGDLLDAGRDFIVGVWAAKGLITDVSLSGAVGYSWIHEPSPVTKRLFGESVLPPQLWYFSPRKPGTVKLSITVRENEKPIPVEREYTIRGVYHFAVRLGLGLSWSPWARKVGVRTAADGQRYAAVVSGADGGLVDNELVAGISYFFKPVKQDSLDLRCAVGLRLGVVDIGAGNGWFQSLMAGVELAAGQDLSIGIFGGIRRIDLPDSGYEPGKLLLPGEPIPTHLGVTPAFGVVLNFTPGFLKFFGRD